jgi:hypothetical protein
VGEVRIRGGVGLRDPVADAGDARRPGDVAAVAGAEQRGGRQRPVVRDEAERLLNDDRIFGGSDG